MFRRLVLLVLALASAPLAAQEPQDTAGALVPYRGYSSAVALSDQKILIVGGRTREWDPTRQAEIFDIGSQRFRAAGQTCFYYFVPRLLPLNDGRVLAAGRHYKKDNCSGQVDVYWPELYDPDTNTWSLFKEIEFVDGEAVYADQFYDGSVLILTASHDRLFGSSRRDAQMYRAWLYDSDLGTVEVMQPLLSPRAQAYPAILPSGDVLITGGSGARFEPEHLCEQVPAEAAIAAGEPSGDWCAANGRWFSVAATTTETWDILWSEQEVHEQLPFGDAFDLYTQVLENGDVLAVTRVDRNRTTPRPRSAAVWSMKARQWSSLADFPPYYHLDLNDELVELDDGMLIGPSGGYAPLSGEWRPFERSLAPMWTVRLPGGEVGFLRTEAPIWTVVDTTSDDWFNTAE